MNCQEIHPKLYLYVDGELEAAEMMAVSAHLKECVACRTLLAELEQENKLLGVATSAPSWDAARLDQLEKRLLRKIEPERPSVWQEFLGLLADAAWLGMLIMLLCLFMAAIHFNGSVIYELAGASSMAAATKSLIPALFFVSGLILLFVLFKYSQFQSLSKKPI
jgi:anti-sigma factor RsiW